MSEGVTNERGIEFSSKCFLTASLITPSSSPREDRKRGPRTEWREGGGPVLPNSRDKVQGTERSKLASKKRGEGRGEGWGGGRKEGRWKRGCWQTHLSAVGPVLVALRPAGKISGPNSRARSLLRKSPRWKDNNARLCLPLLSLSLSLSPGNSEWRGREERRGERAHGRVICSVSPVEPV